MRLDLKRGVVVATIAFAMTGIAELVALQEVNSDAQILADFKERVKAYVALRDKVDGDAPKLQETKDAAKIKAAQLRARGADSKRPLDCEAGRDLHAAHREEIPRPPAARGQGARRRED